MQARENCCHDSDHTLSTFVHFGSLAFSLCIRHGVIVERVDLPYIRVAKAGGWRANLPKECAAAIESAWGSLMEDMGYELTVPSLVEAAVD